MIQLKIGAVQKLKEVLLDTKVRWSQAGPLIRVQGCGCLDFEMGRSFRTANKHLRWAVRTRPAWRKHRLVVIRLQPGNASIQDFVLLHRVPQVIRYFTLTDLLAREEGTVCGTVTDLVSSLLDLQEASRK